MLSFYLFIKLIISYCPRLRSHGSFNVIIYDMLSDSYPKKHSFSQHITLTMKILNLILDMLWTYGAITLHDI